MAVSRVLHMNGDWLRKVGPWAQCLPTWTEAMAVRIDNDCPAVKVSAGGNVVGLVICYTEATQHAVLKEMQRAVLKEIS